MNVGIGGCLSHYQLKIFGARQPPSSRRAQARCSGCSGLILPAKAPSYLETTAKLLKLLEGVSGLFSKCALKSLNNQADFDSAIRRFDPSRPSQQTPISAAEAKLRYGSRSSGPRRWTGLNSAGHSVSGVRAVETVAEIVDQTLRE